MNNLIKKKYLNFTKTENIILNTVIFFTPIIAIALILLKENQALIEYKTKISLILNPGNCMLKNTTIGIKENLEFHVYFQGEGNPYHVIAVTEKGIIRDESNVPKGKKSLNGKLLKDIYKEEQLVYRAKIENNKIKVLKLIKRYDFPFIERLIDTAVGYDIYLKDFYKLNITKQENNERL